MLLQEAPQVHPLRIHVPVHGKDAFQGRSGLLHSPQGEEGADPRVEHGQVRGPGSDEGAHHVHRLQEAALALRGVARLVSRPGGGDQPPCQVVRGLQVLRILLVERPVDPDHLLQVSESAFEVPQVVERGRQMTEIVRHVEDPLHVLRIALHQETLELQGLLEGRHRGLRLVGSPLDRAEKDEGDRAVPDPLRLVRLAIPQTSVEADRLPESIGRQVQLVRSPVEDSQVCQGAREIPRGADPGGVRAVELAGDGQRLLVGLPRLVQLPREGLRAASAHQDVLDAPQGLGLVPVRLRHSPGHPEGPLEDLETAGQVALLLPDVGHGDQGVDEMAGGLLPELRREVLEVGEGLLRDLVEDSGAPDRLELPDEVLDEEGRELLGLAPGELRGLAGLPLGVSRPGHVEAVLGEPEQSQDDRGREQELPGTLEHGAHPVQGLLRGGPDPMVGIGEVVDEPSQGLRDALDVGDPGFEGEAKGLGRLEPGGMEAPTRQELAQQETEGVHVGGRASGLPPGLLRAHVAGGADDSSRRRVQTDALLETRRPLREVHRSDSSGFVGQHLVGQRGLVLRKAPSQAEVEDLDGPIRGHQDVRGFQVPVDDPFLVGCRQRFEDLHGQPEALPGRHRVLEDLAQAAPANELQDEELAVLGLQVVVDPADPGVREAREEPGLLQEAALDLGIVGVAPPDGLDRDLPLQGLVPGDVHLSHPTPSEDLGDPVVADRTPEQRDRGGCRRRRRGTLVHGSSDPTSPALRSRSRCPEDVPTSGPSHPETRRQEIETRAQVLGPTVVHAASHPDRGPVMNRATARHRDPHEHPTSALPTPEVSRERRAGARRADRPRDRGRWWAPLVFLPLLAFLALGPLGAAEPGPPADCPLGAPFTLTLAEPAPGSEIWTTAHSIDAWGTASCAGVAIDRTASDESSSSGGFFASALGVVQAEERRWLAKDLTLDKLDHSFTARRDLFFGGNQSFTVHRIRERQLVAEMTIGGAPVVVDGEVLADAPPTLGSGPGEAVVTVSVPPQLDVRLQALLLDGRVVGTPAAGPDLVVDLGPLLPDLEAGPARLGVQVEVDDTQQLVVSRASYTWGAGTTLEGEPLADVPVVLAGGIGGEPVAPAWLDELPTAPGTVRDVAFTNDGGVWVLLGDPVTTSWNGPTQVLDGTTVRHRFTRTGAGPATYAYLCTGCAGWVEYPGNGAVLTALAPAADAGPGTVDEVWLGTDQGLFQLGQIDGVPPGPGSLALLEQRDRTTGLVGDWVSALDAGDDGVLRVGHLGAEYTTAHPLAGPGQRQWSDPGGVSLRAANGTWTRHAAIQRPDGTWEGIAGFDVTAVIRNGGTGLWAATEEGVSQWVPGAPEPWSLENAESGLPEGLVPRHLVRHWQNGELWVGGPGGAARRTGDGTWTGFSEEDVPPTIGAATVLDLAVDAAGRIWFLTAEAGLVSFDPESLVWNVPGQAATTVAIRGADEGLLAFADDGGSSRPLRFVDAVSPVLVSPPYGEGFPVGGQAGALAEGLAEVFLSWFSRGPILPDAWDLEVSPAGGEDATALRIGAPPATVDLPPGSYRWRVRSRGDGEGDAVVGPWSAIRSFEVVDTRERRDLHLVVPSEVEHPSATSNAADPDYAVGKVELLHLHLARGTTHWQVESFGSPHGEPEHHTSDVTATRGAAGIELLRLQWECPSYFTTENCDLVEAVGNPLDNFAGRGFDPLTPDFPNEGPFSLQPTPAVDRTSEPGGFVVSDIEPGHVRLFDTANELGFPILLTHPTLPSPGDVLDVAGLPNGRFAALVRFDDGMGTVATQIQVQERLAGIPGPLFPVATIDVPDAAHRLAGLVDGGLALLEDASASAPGVRVFDDLYDQIAFHPLPDDGGERWDVESDAQGRVLVLEPGPAVDAVTGGSFEAPDVCDQCGQPWAPTGWTFDPGGDTLLYDWWDPIDGDQLVGLGTSSEVAVGEGTMRTVVATTPGESYLLEVGLSPEPPPVATMLPGFPANLRVLVDGVEVADVTHEALPTGDGVNDATQWRVHSLVVPANGLGTEIALEGSGALVDRVRLLAGPRLWLLDDPYGGAWRSIPLPLHPIEGGAATRTGFRDLAAFAPLASDVGPLPVAAGATPPSFGGDFSEIPGSPLWVFHPAPASYTSCATNGGGSLWILGFLRTDAGITCDSDTSPTWIQFTDLRLDYQAFGYAPGLPNGGPQGAGAQILAGAHRLELATGRITPVGGGAVSFADPAFALSPVGSFTADHLLVMGMGELAASTPFGRGLVGVAGTTAATYGLGTGRSSAITFDHLFLGDLSGKWLPTFGGLLGVDAGVTATVAKGEGSFRFTEADAPLRFRTTGPLDGTGGNLSFPLAVEADVMVGGVPLLTVPVRQLSLGPAAVGFSIDEEILGTFGLEVAGGCLGDSTCIGGPGGDAIALRAAVAELRFGQVVTASNLTIGADGFRFDTLEGVELPGIFSTTLTGVELDLPDDTGPGGLRALEAGVTVDGQFRGSIGGFDLPFGFFDAPPSGFPTACLDLPPGIDCAVLCLPLLPGGECAELPPDPEDPPTFRMRIGGGVTVQPNKIGWPSVDLEVHRPRDFTLALPGGEITPTSVTLFDAPPVSTFGGTLSLGPRIRVSTTGLLVDAATLEVQGTTIDLENFEILGNAPYVRLTGGGFARSGFEFSFSNLTDTGSAFQLDALFSWRPYLVGAGARFTIGEGTFAVGPPFVLPSRIQIGPFALRMDDDDFAIDDGPPEQLTLGGTFEMPKLPEIGATLVLRDRDFFSLAVQASFDPGRPIPGVPGGTLQELSGGLAISPFELRLGVVATAGPQIELPALLAGTSNPVDVSLALLDAEALIHQHGFYAGATLDLFAAPPIYSGYRAGSAGVAVGYLPGLVPWARPSGSGFYLHATVDLFEVLRGGSELFFSSNAFRGTAWGRLGVPRWVPVVGGHDLARIDLQAEGTFSPPRFAFAGTAGLDLGCFPVRSCSYEKCQQCDTGFDPFSWICAEVDCPASCSWVDECVSYDVAVRMSNDDFEIDFFRALAAGDGPAGIAVFADFRSAGPSRIVGGRSTRGGVTETEVEIDVTTVAPSALVRIDWSGEEGDVHLDLELPDGRIFTAETTPLLGADLGVGPEPLPGDLPIRYQHRIGAAADEISEALYAFRGPWQVRQVAIEDLDGPTGEVVEVFEPGPIPQGTYRVTVRASGAQAADPPPVELLLGNNLPVLSAAMETLGPPSYRTSWTVEDADGDPVRVQVHVGADLGDPSHALPIGDPGGFFVGDVLPPGVSETTSFDFTLDRDDLREVEPAHVFFSWVDGSFASVEGEDVFVPRGPRRFVHVATLEPVPDPQAPPQVEGVVAEVGADGSLTVVWDPTSWTPPGPEWSFEGYGVSVVELTPEGVERTPAFSSAAAGEDARGGGAPLLGETATTIPAEALVPGQLLRVTVGGLAREQREIVCACGAPPEPGSLCETVPVEDCDLPVTVPVDHHGPSSTPIDVLLACTDCGNLSPRFLQGPLDRVEVGSAYAARVRAEDANGDDLELVVVPHSAPLPDPDPPSPIAFEIEDLGAGEWSLSFVPAAGQVGVHPIGLEVHDGFGGSARLDFVLTVGKRGELRSDDAESGEITSIPPARVRVGETFSHRIVVGGVVSSLELSHRLAEGPAGMTIDEATGLLDWTPGPGDVGAHRYRVVAGEAPADGFCSTCVLRTVAESAFALEVVEDPLASFGPTLTAGPATIEIGPEGGDVQVAVGQLGGSVDWTAAPLAPWLSAVGPASGTGPGTLTVAVEPWDGPTVRVGTIAVEGFAAGTATPALRSPATVTIRQGLPAERPPRIVGIGAIPGPAALDLAVSGTAVTAPTQLLVRFSERMLDPGSENCHGDVENPAAYRILAAGADGVVETPVCGDSTVGDDVAIAVSEVVYRDETSAAALRIAGSRALGPGLHRLDVCSDGGMRDLSGRALDGDGDGRAGGDFALELRVASENLLANPAFDQDLGGWQLASPTGSSWDAADADDAFSSGSLRFVDPGSVATPGVVQCVDLPTGEHDRFFRVRGARRIDAGQAEVRIDVLFRAGSGCSGAELGTATLEGPASGPTGGAWSSFGGPVTPPDGAASAWVWFLLPPVGGGLEAGLDSLVFESLQALFADGFESGDTSAWDQ